MIIAMSTIAVRDSCKGEKFRGERVRKGEISE